MAGPGTAQVREWLAATAWPLSSLRAGTPNNDLRPWQTALTGVRVVGLGEATHGTREFFQLKHRLLEFLVTELGFTTLAMESSESAAGAVDTYVRGGPGTAAGVVTGLGFWTWRTDEMVATVEWMRAHNAGRPAAEQLGFVGIDPQKCAPAVAVVREYLRMATPDRVADFESGLAAQVDAGPGAHPDAAHTLVREAEALAGFLEQRDAPPEVVRHAHFLVRAAEVVNSSSQHKDPDRTVFAVRDRLMAEAVAGQLADPDAKVVLWAHNGHLAAGRTTPELRPLGKHLRERFGAQYYALALLCGSGSFRARRIWPGPWPGRRDGPVLANRLDLGGFRSVEGQLAAATPGDHLLDLRSAADAPAAVQTWLDEVQMVRSFGAYVARWTHRFQFAPTHLRTEYDGVAYVATSTPSRALAD